MMSIGAIIRAGLIASAIFVGMLFSAHAQEPGGFQGPIPSQGIGLVIWGGGQVEHLATAAPSAGSFWVTLSGRLVGFVADAPDFVNQDFLSQYADDVVPAGTPMLLVISSPVPGATPSEPGDDTLPTEGCDEWPDVVESILQTLALPDGLCLRLIADPDDRPEWMMNGPVVSMLPATTTTPAGSGAAYGPTERTVYFAFSRNPFTGELGTLMHEACHAHQHALTLASGFGDELHRWVETPAGAAYVSAVGWSQDDDGQWMLPGLGFFGQTSPLEDNAEFCSHWFDASGYWDTEGSTLRASEPTRAAWAEEWLP